MIPLALEVVRDVVDQLSYSDLFSAWVLRAWKLSALKHWQVM